MAANGWCPSGRFFEAAACATPLITDAWDGLDSFFNPQSELRVVASAEEVEAALSSPDANCNPWLPVPGSERSMSIRGNVRAPSFCNTLRKRAPARSMAPMKKEVVQ